MAGIFRIDRINWNAILLCFLAAAVFWLFSALNQDHISDLNIPLRIAVDETKFAESQAHPPFIRVQVEGKGWTLLAKTLDWQPDIFSPTIEDPVATKFILLTSFQNQLRYGLGDLRILQIYGDTLHLSFEKKKTRVIRLRADLANVQVKQGFGIFESAVVNPDTAVISGPASIVDQVSDPFFLKPVEKRANGNYSKVVDLDFPERISSKSPKASVQFKAIPAQEINRMIPVRIESGILRWKRKGTPDSVRVYFLIPQEMNPSALHTVYASISVKGKEPVYGKPALMGLPENVKVIRVDSVKIR